MPKLTIIRGVPGSGKSTFARLLADAEGGVHVEADFVMVKNGVYEYDRKKLSFGHKWCQDTARYMLSNGYNVIVSNTFAQVSWMSPYLKISKEIGCDLEVIRMVKEYGSIHGVPEDKMKWFRDSFEPFKGEVRVG